MYEERCEENGVAEIYEPPKCQLRLCGHDTFLFVNIQNRLDYHMSEAHPSVSLLFRFQLQGHHIICPTEENPLPVAGVAFASLSGSLMVFGTRWLTNQIDEPISKGKMEVQDRQQEFAVHHYLHYPRIPSFDCFPSIRAFGYRNLIWTPCVSRIDANNLLIEMFREIIMPSQLQHWASHVSNAFYRTQIADILIAFEYCSTTEALMEFAPYIPDLQENVSGSSDLERGMGGGGWIVWYTRDPRNKELSSRKDALTHFCGHQIFGLKKAFLSNTFCLSDATSAKGKSPGLRTRNVQLIKYPA